MDQFAHRLVGAQGIAAFNANLRERRAAQFDAALTHDEAASLFDVARLQAAIAGPGPPAAQTDIYRLTTTIEICQN